MHDRPNSKESDKKPSGKQTELPVSETEVHPQFNGTKEFSPAQVVKLQSIVGNKAVQRMIANRSIKTIQRAVQVQAGNKPPKAVSNLTSLCSQFEIEKNNLVEPIKTLLFQGLLFPQSYQLAYPNSPTLQDEMQRMVFNLSNLIKASQSQIVITAPTGDAQAVANQLVNVLGNAIDINYLNQFSSFRNITGLGNVDPTRYLSFLDAVVPRIQNYKQQLPEHDYLDTEDDMVMRNRLEKLQAKAKSLSIQLADAIQNPGGNAVETVMAEFNTFTNELQTVENAWDLDFLEGYRDLEGQVNTDLTNDVGIGNKYEIDGGTDDGMSVKDNYNPNLACTLYAILEVKPGWLGANNPHDLHKILRKTGKLNEYDDDRTAAKLRYLAGLTPTKVGNQNTTVNTYLTTLGQRQERDSIIIDAEDVAHTFAAKWKNNTFQKVDEQTPGGGGFGQYANKKILVVWK